MRIESSVTSVSWIPSEAIEGILRLPFDMAFRYDPPPPDVLDDLEQLRAADGFRFANQLKAWIEVEDGKIVRHGHSGKGIANVTKLQFGPMRIAFSPVGLPERRPAPSVTATSVRFVQSAGGQTGFPLMPRLGSGSSVVRVIPPLAWTTLALVINADGSSSHELVGASPFPRHWIYDRSGKLVGKSGVIDFKTWSVEDFRRQTPWGDRESPALVTAVESALERELSSTIMRGGAKPAIRKVDRGTTLVDQGQEGNELFLLLDGVLSVEVDGKVVAEVGPGAILGERALLEGGRRTATLRAVTPCRVAVATADQVAPEALAEVAKGHRREET